MRRKYNSSTIQLTCLLVVFVFLFSRHGRRLFPHEQVVPIFSSFYFISPKRTTRGPGTCCNATMTNFNVTTRPHFCSNARRTLSHICASAQGISLLFIYIFFVSLPFPHALVEQHARSTSRRTIFLSFFTDAFIGTGHTAHLSSMPMMMDVVDGGILSNTICDRLSRTQLLPLFFLDSMK